MTGPDKPMLAFAVLEEDENTGGIIYATSAVAARRLGANEYADGDFSYVRCSRAKWADNYFGKALPVSLMIEHGWHFECGGCGRRVDSDMLWERQLEPEDVIGHQHSIVYCDARCEAHGALDRAERDHLQKRWLRRFAKIVKRRFPDADPVHCHAYASRSANRYRLDQVTVEFDFPGREYGMATLSWRRPASYEKLKKRKPTWSCSNGDREAFETYAAATRRQPEVQAA